MAVKDIFKISRKTFFNPSGWLGYQRLKGGIIDSWGIMRDLFIVPEPQDTETFAEAAKRFNLTETDIKEREKDYLFYSVIFLIIAIFSFIFSFYVLFVKHTFSGCLLGLAVAALFGSQAFRYHFWYFQIKQRKLGCTYQEWRDSLLGHKNNNKKRSKK